MYALIMLRCEQPAVLEPVLAALLSASAATGGGHGADGSSNGAAALLNSYTSASGGAAMLALQHICGVQLPEARMDTPPELAQLQQDMAVDDVSVAALLTQPAAMEASGVVTQDDYGQSTFDFPVRRWQRASAPRTRVAVCAGSAPVRAAAARGAHRVTSPAANRTPTHRVADRRSCSACCTSATRTTCPRPAAAAAPLTPPQRRPWWLRCATRSASTRARCWRVRACVCVCVGGVFGCGAAWLGAAPGLCPHRRHGVALTSLHTHPPRPARCHV
jgi:hypothetical protein